MTLRLTESPSFKLIQQSPSLGPLPPGWPLRAAGQGRRSTPQQAAASSPAERGKVGGGQGQVLGAEQVQVEGERLLRWLPWSLPIFCARLCTRMCMRGRVRAWHMSGTTAAACMPACTLPFNCALHTITVSLSTQTHTHAHTREANPCAPPLPALPTCTMFAATPGSSIDSSSLRRAAGTRPRMAPEVNVSRAPSTSTWQPSRAEDGGTGVAEAEQGVQRAGRTLDCVLWVVRGSHLNRLGKSMTWLVCEPFAASEPFTLPAHDWLCWLHACIIRR